MTSSANQPRLSSLIVGPMKTHFRTWKNVFLIAIAISFLFAGSIHAEEPVKKFLARLRDEGLSETGIKYLDLCAARDRLPASMKGDLPLERNILLQDSIKNAKTPQQRDERIAAIEQGYKQFLDASPTHPRRSEAQTKLGDLLLERAQTFLSDSKKDENKESATTLRSKARDVYTEAMGLYAKIIEELKPILESMKGDKIKASDTEGKERREQYQKDYRGAQILNAKMMEFMSQTYDPQSADWRKWLENSEAALSQIIEKTTGPTEAGRRMLSLLYRGEVQRQLGKIDDARESFTRVSENEGPGIFRTWKVQAIAAIVRLDSTEKSAKFEAAIDRGETTLKQATANDRNEPEWIDLQLAVAEARMAFSKTLEEKKDENKFRNNRKAAREMLQAIVKKQGARDAAIVETVRKAKKLLSELGIEIAEKIDTKLPETRTFAEACKAGRERLDRAESTDATLPILEQQLVKADAETKQSVGDQVKKIKEDSLRDRMQAIELYERALRLFREKDDRSELLEAKYLLSYMFLRTDQYWESVAIAQELVVPASGVDKAENAGGFALLGLNKLIVEAPSERQMALVPPLEKLAGKLFEISPDSDNAQGAVELLVKLALINKRFDEAEKYIATWQSKGGSSVSILGKILWSEYRTNSAKHRSEKTEETASDASLKQRAEKLLASSWENLVPAKTDKNVIAGVNTLASIYLSTDRIDEALSVLNDPQKGAILLIETKSDLEPSLKLEAYRLKLQAMVQAAGQGKGPLSSDEVTRVVQKMKDLSASDDSLLTSSLRNLAVEIKSKLEATKNMDDQAKLGVAFGVLIQQLISFSSDVGTLDSAGTSILNLASDMVKVPALAPNGKQLMLIAEEAFSKIANKPEADLVAAGRKPEEFQFRLAQSKSGAGKHEEAHKLFVKALTKSETVLQIQVEAARNLQEWSAGKDAELLKMALLGTEPNDKKAKMVWGWGKISEKTLARINDFKDTFFEARLNIAKCRRMIALTESGDPRKKALERAVADIRQTMLNFPELGGPDHEPKFSKLLLELQLDLGKPTIGLNEFKQTSPPKPDSTNK